MKLGKKILLGALSLFVLFSLVRNLTNYYSTQKFYESYKADYEKAKKRNVELRTQALKNSDPEQIEKVIRNSLNLARPDETVIILPHPTPTVSVPTPTPKPVYLQWADVFFRN